jgi:hypothetical protein
MHREVKQTPPREGQNRTPMGYQICQPIDPLQPRRAQILW